MYDVDSHHHHPYNKLCIRQTMTMTILTINTTCDKQQPFLVDSDGERGALEPRRGIGGRQDDAYAPPSITGHTKHQLERKMTEKKETRQRRHGKKKKTLTSYSSSRASTSGSSVATKTRKLVLLFPAAAAGFPLPPRPPSPSPSPHPRSRPTRPPPLARRTSERSRPEEAWPRTPSRSGQKAGA